MKIIYIGLLIVLIFIYYLLTRYNYNLYEKYSNNIIIAVVGNGKLTDKDIKKINKCNMICRFNDVKNYNYLNRTDILFVRQNGNSNKIHGLNNYTTNVKCKELIFIGSWKESYDNIKKKNKIPIHMINIYEDHCKKNNKCIVNNNSEFIFENKKYIVPHTISYLSSGTIAINYLLKRFPNAKLEIFGMNWNFHNSIDHPKNFEKMLISKCKRCNINKMKYKKY